MKRAKLMLMSIAVLAVVGGALAFKTNSKFTNTYCILTTLNNPGGGTCTNEIANSKFWESGTAFSTYYYTTKTAGAICTQKQCIVSTSFVKNN